MTSGRQINPVSMISVVICTYNRADMLRRSLESFFQQDGLESAPFELVVVDNNSGDHTRSTIESFASHRQLRYAFEPQQGLSAARNRGVAESRGDVVAFLDDDVVVDRSWLSRLKQAFEETAAAAVGGKSYLVFEAPPPPWLGEGMRRLLSEVNLGPARCEVPDGRGLFGLNLSFRKSALVQAGGFDEHLGRTGSILLGGEETALLRRIAASRACIIYDPDVVVGHIIEPSRLEWSYFERLAVGVGRSLALADPPAPAPARLWRVGRSVAGAIRAVVTIGYFDLIRASPYLRRRWRRKYLTARARLAVHWSALWNGESIAERASTVFPRTAQSVTADAKRSRASPQ